MTVVPLAAAGDPSGAAAFLARVEAARDDWQDRLRLRDWDVRILIVRIGEMGELGTWGSCEVQTNKRKATISILDPRDYDGQGFHAETFDWEATLVHELLHVHVHDMLPGPWRQLPDSVKVAAERMIDHVSTALVTAKRGTHV